MRFLITTALIAFLMPIHHVMGQEPDRMGTTSKATDAGFEEALFDVVTLKNLLKDDNLVGVRFYNVLAKSTDKAGTAMAVGIYTDGSEPSKGKAYRVSLGFVKGKIAMSNLRAKEAKIACESMQNSGHPSYSSSFTRTEVEALMAFDGCDALRATPDVTDKKLTTMQLTAMKVTGAKAEPVGTDPRYQRLCGFPCPSICGPDHNYVYRYKE